MHSRCCSSQQRYSATRLDRCHFDRLGNCETVGEFLVKIFDHRISFTKPASQFTNAMACNKLSKATDTTSYTSVSEHYIVGFFPMGFGQCYRFCIEECIAQRVNIVFQRLVIFGKRFNKTTPIEKEELMRTKRREFLR